MYDPWEHHAKSDEPDTKVTGHTLPFIRNVQNSAHRESRVVAARGWGQGSGERLLLGTAFGENVLELDSGGGCLTPGVYD